MICDEPVAADDLGVVMPHVEVEAHRTTDQPMHRECFVLSVFGSAVHQAKGSHLGHEPCDAACDDSSLPRREAARAALAAFERERGGAV